MTLDKFGKTEHTKYTTSSKSSSISGDNKGSSENRKKQSSKEVEEYLYREVYFAHSKTPRRNRPPQVKLKVGQVVKHKQDGYYGVIVGWDEVARVCEIISLLYQS